MCVKERETDIKKERERGHLHQVRACFVHREDNIKEEYQSGGGGLPNEKLKGSFPDSASREKVNTQMI